MICVKCRGQMNLVASEPDEEYPEIELCSFICRDCYYEADYYLAKDNADLEPRTVVYDDNADTEPVTPVDDPDTIIFRRNGEG